GRSSRGSRPRCSPGLLALSALLALPSQGAPRVFPFLTPFSSFVTTWREKQQAPEKDGLDYGMRSRWRVAMVFAALSLTACESQEAVPARREAAKPSSTPAATAQATRSPSRGV